MRLEFPSCSTTEKTEIDALNKVLVFGALVEIGTGVVLIIAPTTVVALLLGPNEWDQGMLLGRFLGIVLLALGFACRPRGLRAVRSTPAFQAMLGYNVLATLYLAYLGAIEHQRGLLLWPAVMLHAVMALLLIWTWRDEPRSKAV